MSMDSGVVRIKPHDWALLTKLAVNVSVKLQKPINQATILNSIMKERLEDVTANEACEMVVTFLEEK